MQNQTLSVGYQALIRMGLDEPLIVQNYGGVPPVHPQR
jgi:hypothetical protein